MENTFLLIHPSSYPDNTEADIREGDILEVGDKSIPLGIAAIGSYLKYKGFEIDLLDCRLFNKKDIKSSILNKINNYFAVGFSVMTGQLSHALELTDFIKDIQPELPIIWGGTHPTLYPIQTIRDNNIDYVIAGEGEKVIEYLLNLLKTNSKPIKLTDGLLYKENDRIINTENHTSPIDVNEMPDINYDLLTVEKLVKIMLLNGKTVRGLGILTSRGCPYKCAFCTVPHLNTRKWRAIPPERVLNIIDHVVKSYDLNYIWFIDDYFFGNIHRFKIIMNGIIDLNLHIQWSANVRVDNFSDKLINDEMLVKLKQSGCYALHMGMESGDDNVLKIYNKGITTEQIENAVRKCCAHGILPNGTFMMGIPGESTSSILKTIKLINKLHQIDKENTVYAPGIYRPLPGGTLYQSALKAGFIEPKTIRDWTKYKLSSGFLDLSYLPWIQNPTIIQGIRFYGRITTAYKKGLFSKGYLKLFLPIAWLSQTRFSLGLFNFQIEIVFFKIIKFIARNFLSRTYLSKLVLKN